MLGRLTFLVSSRSLNSRRRVKCGLSSWYGSPVFFIKKITGCAADWRLQLNSLSSFVSDMSWAYAMLLTTPLVVTVGLSLTIPLSLVGEMIQYAQYSSWVYWIGALVVVLSFVFINHESHEEETDAKGARAGDSGPQSTDV